MDKNFRSAPELIPGEEIDRYLGGGHFREMPKRRGAASASTCSNVHSRAPVYLPSPPPSICMCGNTGGDRSNFESSACLGLPILTKIRSPGPPHLWRCRYLETYCTCHPSRRAPCM
ncbi:hypothetical protein CY34DRAFT_808285 [Suillus luteus UH-Slu-Lm8-n1]|uniref:Uncharacterized protein n=1 Tax=Suillus luteus UH-Slu-Lm8-n1 TaxID=930992 RepID=A0A0D0AN49_9AGAM|nr:hypothetical protein CY34DRAFT_808285 [Suillus luteus UH-Slu-Lm8-n1]